jgi:glycosyltransferase involved in cell wall biosynthesis
VRIALWTETFLPRIDGIVTRLTATLEELKRCGDEVIIFAPTLEGQSTEYAGMRVVHVPSIHLPMYRDFAVGLPFTVHSATALLQAFRPELIHVVNPAVLGIEGIAMARRLRVPLVASYHTHLPAYAARYHLGALEPTIWWYLRLLHNRAQLNLCTSQPVADQLRRRGIQRVALWHPGVNTQLFSPAARSSEWRMRLSGGQAARVILLYVGRLAAEKELETLATVLPALPGAHLALVGEGPYQRPLERCFASMPVTFLGPLRGEALAAAYASADIFVLPSTTETLGLAAIEAMASGTCVVGAMAGGLRWTVVEGQTGLLFDPMVAGDLLGCLSLLLEHQDLRQAMGKRARERAMGWSWQAATERLRQEYRRVVDGG